MAAVDRVGPMVVEARKERESVGAAGFGHIVSDVEEVHAGQSFDQRLERFACLPHAIERDVGLQAVEDDVVEHDWRRRVRQRKKPTVWGRAKKRRCSE